jgi:cytochrome c553
MKTFIALASALTLSLAAAAAPADDAANKAQTVCAACHGGDGNSFNGEWPKLAGQHASYSAAQLTAFRCAATGQPKGCVARNSANSALMIGQAAALTDAEIAALAEHFAKQTLKPGVADAKLVAVGQKLYQGGSKKNATAACTACHGPDGRGNAAAKFPAIGGQHAAYVAAQLKAYRDGSRRGDKDQMMRNIAGTLSDDEIAAVASYIQGLH